MSGGPAGGAVGSSGGSGGGSGGGSSGSGGGPGSGTGPRWSRRAVVGGLALAPALLTAACGHSKPRPAEISISPADGTAKGDPSRPVTVTATNGTLKSVKVATAAGGSVAGRFSQDRTSWTSTGRLAAGTGFKVAATAADSAGRTVGKSSAFTTGAVFFGEFTPDHGATVGVGMPVSITFNTPVTDRAAVQRGITVRAEPAVEVVGHWFGDQRLDFRPQEYWKPGTKVTLSLRLKGVEGARHTYGYQQKDVVFGIGRSQTSVVDLAAKRITVTRDGRTTQTWPVSGGGPGHTTWAGKMVIAEKFLKTRMNSQTVNLGGEYDIPDVPHAQRLTTSGTFIHGNYWSGESVFGSQNTSHGCVGMHDVQGAGDPSTPAAKFYNSSMVGDIVEIINSGDRTVQPDNGLNGWNMSWADWKAGAAT
ncbi:L,D-transpeptidase [Phaeacidiphilus oryzae]|uniref:L,D-transpeptidase n=1 Tax=Phaeacidiphilus oryzae TaxID=348818 RepID=UPI000A029D47|nr:Ig-like domain-containing protein [Phaeacidiphilus oryzae]